MNTTITVHPDGSVTIPAADRETLTRALMWAGVSVQRMATEADEVARARRDMPRIAARHRRNHEHDTALAAAIADLGQRLSEAVARAGIAASPDDNVDPS